MLFPGGTFKPLLTGWSCPFIPLVPLGCLLLQIMKNNNDRGHVRIYKFDGTAWNQVGVDIDGEANHDHFGLSVAMNYDGSTVAIGAPHVSCLFSMVSW